jgi:hypothetical protein
VKYRTIIKKLLKIEQENEMKTLILEFGNGWHWGKDSRAHFGD